MVLRMFILSSSQFADVDNSRRFPTLHNAKPSLPSIMIWILARYDIRVVRLRTMSYVHPTTSYVRRTMSGSTSHVRYRTYDITYKKNPFIHVFYHQSSERHPGHTARAILHVRVGTTSYVCPSQHRRCDIRHRTYDIRYRRFRKIYVVYDVVCQRKPTTS